MKPYGFKYTRKTHPDFSRRYDGNKALATSGGTMMNSFVRFRYTCRNMEFI